MEDNAQDGRIQTLRSLGLLGHGDRTTHGIHTVLPLNFPFSPFVQASFFVYLFFLILVARNILRASLVAQKVKNLPTMQETQIRSLGREDLLEKEMATHSSILA